MSRFSMMSGRWVSWLAAAAAGLGLGLWMMGTSAVVWADDKEDAALARTRGEVKMLDDLYKNAVVSITQRYMDGPPAAKVAKDVFGAMAKAGHHDAKLVDATGNPQNEANLPATEFEKRAADAMRAGKPYYEEVVGAGADRHLLAATVVPAVLPKCASCHGVNEGDLLGFIRYDLLVK